MHSMNPDCCDLKLKQSKRCQHNMLGKKGVNTMIHNNCDVEGAVRWMIGGISVMSKMHRK